MTAAAGLNPDIKAQRFAAEFTRFIDQESVRWSIRAHGILNAEGGRAARAYAMTGQESAALGQVLDTQWLGYLERTWLSTVPRAGALTEELLVKAGTPDIFLQATVRWLRLNAAQRVTGISDTSRDEIGNQIRIGVSKGESRQEIAARITKHRRSISPERALTIGRTEVHAAANYGSLIAAAEVRVPMNKIWVAVGDAHTRDTHRSAQGQRASLADPFRVGGYSLMHPGDSSMGAPAHEIVNCRCVTSYEVARPERAPARPRRVA